ncbi:putative nitrogen fixation protein NifT [Mesorhizobium hawassense]|uniref:Putative nitrogen fixation protein NifT n=1 Tax=Mesorhizobium hawassense TaxID=1209954 RepID=A0A330HAI6_9HYPH|nr:putative nitrogen fixation protein NifT [Mesorhizobium hawassense]RAZ85616.1 putative nitrogen fixation protein NifT [Mesorhizobium hawassense]
MKVMIRSTDAGLSVYLPKKDLEAPIIKVENDDLWGGTVRFRTAWTLILPDLPRDTRRPISVEAKKTSDGTDPDAG